MGASTNGGAPCYHQVWIPPFHRHTQIVVAITVIPIVAETTIYDMSVLAVGQSLQTPLDWLVFQIFGIQLGGPFRFPLSARTTR